MASKRSKKYQDAARKVQEALGPDSDGLVPVRACEVVKDTSYAAFDATVEAHVRLGVDPRHADQMVRGSVVLPNGTLAAGSSPIPQGVPFLTTTKGQ